MASDRQREIVAASLFAVSVLLGRRTVAAVLQNKSDHYDTIAADSSTTSASAATLNGNQHGNRTKYRHPNTAPIQARTIYPDSYYLKHAQQIRLALNPPRQSNFRVVCILLLENGSVIVGTNDEGTPNIAGAICAERAALLAYRMQFTSQPITTIYVVTDSDTAIPPGTLCREYLYGHAATIPSTRCVLQSNDTTSEPWSVTLKELHPYPSLYSSLSSKDQVQFGQYYERQVERLLAKYNLKGTMFNDQVLRLVEAAHQAALEDDRKALHAIHYGAAMAIRLGDKLEILQASQLKALEYGSTQDAICQLVAVLKMRERMERSKNMNATWSRHSSAQPLQIEVLCIVQVDQFGIPHVPFAPARSVLVEHGLGHVQVLLTARDEDDEFGRLTLLSVPARDLSPFLPDFCKEEASKYDKARSEDNSERILIHDSLQTSVVSSTTTIASGSWGMVGQGSLSKSMVFPGLDTI